MGKENPIPLDNISTISATPKILRRVSLGSLAVVLGQGINILRQVLLVPLFLWALKLKLRQRVKAVLYPND